MNRGGSDLATPKLRSCRPPTPATLKPDDRVAGAVADITSPDFPGEQLMVCLNPRLREERSRKREALLQATEETLGTIAAAVRSGRLKDREAIRRRVGRDANRRKVEKHFEIDVTHDSISWSRREGRITFEERDGGIERLNLEDYH